MELAVALYLSLLLHLIGDYVTQSDWMANEKTKNSFPALAHATVYSLPFLWLVTWEGFAIISISHFFIDRFRLARYVCWAKNLIGSKQYRFSWKDSCNTGYSKEKDKGAAWLTVWLMIIADNTMHVCINTAAIWLYLK